MKARATTYDKFKKSADPQSVPQSVYRVLGSSGKPLDHTNRNDMETRFGHDFSNVRVHDDPSAAASARFVNAAAYTVGRDIVFGNSQFVFGTDQRRQLLSHELTHVIQQQRPDGKLLPQNLQIAPDDDRNEKIASQLAAIDHGGFKRIPPALAPPQLQRQPIGETLTRFFGGGTFSNEELQDYLRFLDENDRIEDSYDSDNKAREVVNRWKQGLSLYILPVRRKILLIEEMISGFTGDEDELAILDLLTGATESEFRTIINAIRRSRLAGEFHGPERTQLDHLLDTRLQAEPAQDGAVREPIVPSQEAFPAETILRVQQRFHANTEAANRLNCILIIRELVPQLFAQDPQLARNVQAALNRLTGRQLRMTEVGRVMSEIGLVSDSAEITFEPGNGNQEPTRMTHSAYDTIINMVGNVQGWHIFGMAVFDGYHSVTILVENRADGPRVYWADQWRIDPGDDFYQAPGSISGFRLYEKDGFDRFIMEKTHQWWRKIFNDRGARYRTTLHIWKFRSRLEEP